MTLCALGVRDEYACVRNEYGYVRDEYRVSPAVHMCVFEGRVLIIDMLGMSIAYRLRCVCAYLISIEYWGWVSRIDYELPESVCEAQVSPIDCKLLKTCMKHKTWNMKHQTWNTRRVCTGVFSNCWHSWHRERTQELWRAERPELGKEFATSTSPSPAFITIILPAALIAKSWPRPQTQHADDASLEHSRLFRVYRLD